MGGGGGGNVFKNPTRLIYIYCCLSFDSLPCVPIKVAGDHACSSWVNPPPLALNDSPASSGISLNSLLTSPNRYKRPSTLK